LLFRRETEPEILSRLWLFLEALPALFALT